MTHRQHAKTTELFGSVEDHRWEPAGHLRVQTHFDPRLDFVLSLDEHIQELLGVNRCLPIIGHETNESRIPFVGDLREGRASACHQNLPDSVLELLEAFVVDFDECLSRNLFSAFILKFPDAVLLREFLKGGSSLW